MAGNYLDQEERRGHSAGYGVASIHRCGDAVDEHPEPRSKSSSTTSPSRPETVLRRADMSVRRRTRCGRRVRVRPSRRRRRANGLRARPARPRRRSPARRGMPRAGPDPAGSPGEASTRPSAAAKPVDDAVRRVSTSGIAAGCARMPCHIASAIAYTSSRQSVRRIGQPHLGHHGGDDELLQALLVGHVVCTPFIGPCQCGGAAIACSARPSPASSTIPSAAVAISSVVNRAFNFLTPCSTGKQLVTLTSTSYVRGL